MKVKVKNGNVEQALRLFKRKITESNVLFDYKEKQYHEKKTTRRQKKKAAAVVRERKRQDNEAKNPFGLN
jgi:ribosomal protein S21